MLNNKLVIFDSREWMKRRMTFDAAVKHWHVELQKVCLSLTDSYLYLIMWQLNWCNSSRIGIQLKSIAFNEERTVVMKVKKQEWCIENEELLEKTIYKHKLNNKTYEIFLNCSRNVCEILIKMQFSLIRTI